MSEKALQPIEQKIVTFYGDDLIAVQIYDGTIYVPIRPLCDLMGLSWSGQRERIIRDTILSEMARGVRVTRTPDQGGEQEMTCLPLDALNGWLFGVNDKRVKDSVRESLLRYKRECYKVLADAFGRGAITVAPDSAIEEALANDPDLREAHTIATAILSLIRSQARTQVQVGDHEKRLQILEANTGDASRHISNEQAADISQAVKAIALELGKQSGKNEFAGVYGELYRRFKIPSYKMLPTAKYDEAMSFLRQWWETVSNNDMPF